MFETLPSSTHNILDWTWNDAAPYYAELNDRPIDATNVAAWLRDWTRLGNLMSEIYFRLYVATTRNTADQEVAQRFRTYLSDLYPASQAAEQQLREKLLASGLEPEGMAVPLRNMRAEAALFREANLPLLSEESRLMTEYNRIAGAQTVQWEGQEITLTQLQPVYHEDDRARRERAWRLEMQRRLADRAAINELWGQFMQLRRQLATNADQPDYRSYRWKDLLRFDYTPEDCFTFHRAIEEVVVPAAQRIYAKRRERLGVPTVRPWDVDAAPSGVEPLRPFSSVKELEEKSAAIFDRVDPELGSHFALLRQEGLLDLDNRKNKGPGGYCAPFDAIQKPFIFLNAVGLADNVTTMFHEAGHAFHVFATADLPYRQQRDVPMEFAEVASMAMELLASPYLSISEGGFYTAADAARARVEHIEKIILFWPYMAVVDAFQHWVYEHHDAASDPANCDATWAALWQRFMPGVDWSGLEEEMQTGWHRKQHIHRRPFYYIEYGLAQLGAVLVWRNALRDQAAALAHYREALALGGTVTLPELYVAAGARFAFDSATLREAVDLLEATIAELEH